MVKKVVKKNPEWRAFEQEVANIYRALGAKVVEHDVNKDGHQIDVYVEMENTDTTTIKIIISCKHHDSPAGVETVREWNQVFDALRRSAKSLFHKGVSAIE
jgi:hypothetical protein